MKIWLVSGSYALWLFAIEGVFYLVGGRNETALQQVVLTGLIPLTLQLFVIGFDSRGLVSSTKFALLFLFAVLLSYLANITDPTRASMLSDGTAVPPAWLPIVFFANTAFIFT